MDTTSLHEIAHYLHCKDEEKGNDNINILQVDRFSGHSNNIIRLQLNDGRKMIVKQSDYDWAHPRFSSARNASELLQENGTIVSPGHTYIPRNIEQKPTLAYWYLSFPTLHELWPELNSEQKKKSVRSFGRLLRQLHSIELNSFGLLQENSHFEALSSYIEDDLQNRLKPTMYAKWPDVVPVVDQLTNLINQVKDDEKNAVLIHNDMHIGNILCTTEAEEIECIGLLDLEEARGGCRESDIASAMILHQPLFAGLNNTIDWLQDFSRNLIEGYGQKPDPYLLSFFKAYHLLNLGLFSVMTGKQQHANNILQEVYKAREEIV